MAHNLIGIDLGGTNLRCGIVNDHCEILAHTEAPTPVAEGPAAVIDRMAEQVQTVLADAKLQPGDITCIGLGAPGPLDGRRGVVIEAPNLGWRDVHVTEMLQERTGIQTILENDANAAGFGEFRAGAGRGCQNMIMMTLGTGVGGAVIINGQLLHGPDWTAGEIGHVCIEVDGRLCGCGSRGCIEAYASASSTARRFVEALEAGEASVLAGRDRAAITCADVFDAGRGGDPLAHRICMETARLLGLMAGNMANLLNTERCVFSGGMIRAGAYLFDAIRAACDAHAFDTPAARLEILPAELGDHAGLIGAAHSALAILGKA